MKYIQKIILVSLCLLPTSQAYCLFGWGSDKSDEFRKQAMSLSSLLWPRGNIVTFRIKPENKDAYYRLLSNIRAYVGGFTKSKTDRLWAEKALTALNSIEETATEFFNALAITYGDCIAPVLRKSLRLSEQQIRFGYDFADNETRFLWQNEQCKKCENYLSLITDDQKRTLELVLRNEVPQGLDQAVKVKSTRGVNILKLINDMCIEWKNVANHIQQDLPVLQKPH